MMGMPFDENALIHGACCTTKPGVSENSLLITALRDRCEKADKLMNRVVYL